MRRPRARRRVVGPRGAARRDGYGNQWWTIDGRVTAWGIHGQRIAVGERMVVAILSSWPEAEGLEEAHRALVAGVCDGATEGQRRAG